MQSCRSDHGRGEADALGPLLRAIRCAAPGFPSSPPACRRPSDALLGPQRRPLHLRRLYRQRSLRGQKEDDPAVKFVEERLHYHWTADHAMPARMGGSSAPMRRFWPLLTTFAFTTRGSADRSMASRPPMPWTRQRQPHHPPLYGESVQRRHGLEKGACRGRHGLSVRNDRRIQRAAIGDENGARLFRRGEATRADDPSRQDSGGQGIKK